MENTKPQGKHRILIVDDEQGILNAVRRELSTPPFGGHQYEIEAFTNPLEALERAKVQEFEAVLSDYRMPEMSGLEFLQALAVIQPDCARIVLSGETDFDSLIRMINETHIYRFIPKPWSSYFLKSSLGQAVDLRQANLENRRLAKALREQGIDLPPGTLNEVDQILVVDDEVGVANAVARALTRPSRLDDVFREVREDVQHGNVSVINPGQISVQITNSPLHALKVADDITFSCVIADYRMPDMDGARFLSEFSEKQPECACIMLSGEADLLSVVSALDSAHLSAFIAKPWSDFVLRAAVAQALTRRRLLLETRVLAEMCKARQLGAVD